VSAFLHWYIRHSALLLAVSLVEYKPSARAWRKLSILWRGHTQKETAIQEAIATYFDIRNVFAILEERIQGTLQPFEGILLVKERKQQFARRQSGQRVMGENPPIR
jgi:hypothetical protein